MRFALLTLVLAFALAGCGGHQGKASHTPSLPKTASTSKAPTTPGVMKSTSTATTTTP